MEISALRIRWVSNETGVLAIGAPVRRRQARLQLQLVGIAPPVDGSLPAHEAFTLRTGHALDFLSLPYCAKSALRPSVRTETEVRCQVPRLGSAFCFYRPGKFNLHRSKAIDVSRQVRCENCRFGRDGAEVCGLYETLNSLMPETFHLDVEIEPQGCCNAQLL